MKQLTLLFASLICLTTISIQAQSKTISGYVTNESGTPLKGVVVKIKNNQTVTSTNHLGYYTIQVVSNHTILQFSYNSMETLEIKVNKDTIINVTLKTNSKITDELLIMDCEIKEEHNYVYPSAIKRSHKIGLKCSNAPFTTSHQEFNTENYASITENGYKKVTQDPLSTFSVDVDRASYTNVRRFLNNGQLPPTDAVRIEEMINYFNYDYKTPTSAQPFSVNSEMSTCPWNNEHYLLRVGLKGQEIAKDMLPPSNLVFLIDVSGSMNGANKLPLLKSSFRLLVNELRAEDHVSIVVYAGAAGLVLEPTPGNNKQKIFNALDNLQAGGSTAGGEGLKLAYATAKQHFNTDGNNRIILATDGDFNVGASSNSSMEELVENERKHGIFMTVLGFGMGNYKDDRMEIIADKGNGNYAYIDNLQEAQKTLVSEFGGTLFTIAKDVKFQVEFNPSKILAYRLIGYENRLLNNEDFNDDKKDAGEIGAGHTLTALYELIPRNAKDAEQWIKTTDPLKYQQLTQRETSSSHNEWLNLKLRYKQPQSSKSELMTYAIKGKVNDYQNTSDDMRFIASVAGFGMVLRQSEYKGDMTYSKVIELAKNARGDDEDGFKAEMVRLVKTAQSLSSQIASSDN